VPTMLHIYPASTRYQENKTLQCTLDEEDPIATSSTLHTYL